MLMLNVPAMVGLIVLAEPIVALLYQRGHFTDADTARDRGGAACSTRPDCSATRS